MASYEKEKEAHVGNSSPLNSGEEGGHVTAHDEAEGLTILGYRPELKRNRSMFTLLFQSLAIAAVCGQSQSAPLSTHFLLMVLRRYHMASAARSSAQSTEEDNCQCSWAGSSS